MPSSLVSEGLKIGSWQKIKKFKKMFRYYKTESYLLKTQTPFFGNCFLGAVPSYPDKVKSQNIVLDIYTKSFVFATPAYIL